MILIIGHRADPHVASVTEALSRDGRDFFVIDIFDAHSDGVRFNVADDVVLDIEGSRFDLGAVKSTWWRQKPLSIIPSGSVTDLYNYYFLHREWNQVLEYLSFELSGKFNVNDRKVETRINNKLIQLKYAHEMGFGVPSTLISNNFESINALVLGGENKYIFKTLTPYMTPAGMVTYTTIIDDKLLDEKRESIRTVPGIFQEFKKKLFELRVTIVGEEVFCARINSGYSDKTEVDWRQEIFADIYGTHDLDIDTRARLLSLHRRFGLFFGAYDLIVDDEENYFFMEVNPVGQWMWLEEAVGFPISEHIADALVRGSD